MADWQFVSSSTGTKRFRKVLWIATRWRSEMAPITLREGPLHSDGSVIRNRCRVGWRWRGGNKRVP